MKNYKKITRNAICLLLSIWFFTSCTPSVKVGQEWNYVINKDNPYKRSIIKKRVVISVTNGYVQYIENNIDTFSCSKEWFVIGNELQKSCH